MYPAEVKSVYVYYFLISQCWMTRTNCIDCMMFICRSLGGFKSSVHNKATLEGYITEGYIVT
jgi:hypothetical protein